MSEQKQTKKEISVKRCYYTGPPVEVIENEQEPKRNKTDAGEESDSSETNWYECDGFCINIGGYGMKCETCGIRFTGKKLTMIEVKKRLKTLRAQERLVKINMKRDEEGLSSLDEDECEESSDDEDDEQDKDEKSEK